MSRPLAIWIAFFACALLLIAALAAVSRHTLGIERQRLSAEVEADAGQRVRLALWRMDSAATVTLVRENSRPPAVYGNPDPPADAPDGARLYFEINGNGKLLEPTGQSVSSGAVAHRAAFSHLLQLSPAVGPVDEPVTDGQLVNKDTAASALQPSIKAYQKRQQLAQNADIAFAAANAPQQDGNGLESKTAEDKAVSKDLDANKPAAKAAASASKAITGADANEMNQRAKVVQKSTRQYDIPSAGRHNDENAFGGKGVAVQQESKKKMEAWAASESGEEKMEKRMEQAATGGSMAAAKPPSAAITTRDDDPLTGKPIPPASQPATAIEDSQVTALQPVWIQDELLLVRAVGAGSRQRVQGIWIDRKVLAEALLESIRDLLPAATLVPYQRFDFTRENVVLPSATANLAANPLTATPRSLESVPMAMVSLPWELVPGTIPAPTSGTRSPLKVLLGTAWAGTLLAIAAAAFLLRGVMVLSERRAAFVSSVTHELRTPLTTFTMYSEMLADGMVSDPAKQQGYLRTLQTEAGRLSHLVENVLAYSRIERGSVSDRRESMTVATLADRLLPRLSDRATSVGATIDITLPSDLSGHTLVTDASVVEQIVFNLVDNAAKYAPPVAGEPPWQLVFAGKGRVLQIDFRDHGPGISASEHKRLFQPFHKSAQDAANSKPGVGLGLALSRRLATALGGTLAIVPPTGKGTIFRLTLPLDLVPVGS